MSTEEILHCNLSKSFENSSTEAETPSVKQLEDILYSGQSSCRHVDEVWPNIYLGDMYMAHDRYGLWKMGITHVLNAAHGKMCCKGSQDFYGTTVDYHGVPANDLPDFDLSQYFYSSADYIHKAINSPGAKILVHCAVGVSRSASLVLAYLMLYHHFSLVDAIKKVKENRAIAQDRGALQRMGITHVLNATHSKQGSLGHQSFYGKKIQYYGIAAEDSPKFALSIYFKAAAQFIHKALKKKMERSSALHSGDEQICHHEAYLMLHHHLSLQDTIHKVIQTRAIYPNRFSKTVNKSGYLVTNQTKNVSASVVTSGKEQKKGRKKKEYLWNIPLDLGVAVIFPCHINYFLQDVHTILTTCFSHYKGWD